MRKRHLWGWVFLLALIAIGVGVYLNREPIYEYYRGVTYQPSSEMARIRADLQLTERGTSLFNTSQPVLAEAEAFNAYCRDGETETAVLGCYTSGNIYVYNIKDERLSGIRELTTAHELLHAVWARMSEEEKVALVEPLTRVFEANQDFLGNEIDSYDISEKQEELYVRAGTEVKDLPVALEKHYAEIFQDQDLVVSFYDGYIEVFRALAAEMDGLKVEMDAISSEVNAKMMEYEQRVAQLNANIVSFNSCAEVAGCFETEEEFYEQREVLVAEQVALEGLYEEVNNLITDYNAKVEVYNADVLESEKLNTIINSAAKPREIE